LDNCGGPLDVSYIDDVSGLTDCNGTGSFIRIWTVRDDCNNSTTTIQTIIVEDTLPPTFTVPADLTVYYNAICQLDTTVADIGDVLDETDDCTAGLEATYVDDVSGLTECNGTGTFTRTWTLQDDCDNVSTAVQTITVEDNTPPTLTASATGRTVECDGSGNLTQLNDWIANHGGMTVSEACGSVAWTYTIDGNVPSCTGGATTYTFTATDDCDNTTSSSAEFNIVDTEAPAIPNVPADTTINDCILPVAPSPVSTDDCDDDIKIEFSEVVIRHSLAGRRNGCLVEPIISNLTCDDNGTPGITTDDTFRFTINIDGSGIGAGWVGDIGGSSISGNYGIDLNFGPFLMSDGIVHFILTDDDSPKCKSYISVQAPTNCID